MNAPLGTVCSSSDQVLEQLLDEITNRIQAGERVDLDALVADHPEYADRLQRLLPAMQVLMAFGCSELATASSSTNTEHRATQRVPGIQHPASSIQHLASSTGVLGDFRIVREIGRGGMGVVYEAEQISIGRPVALKVLPFASMLDERRLARFHNEVRAAGQLHHTNIVPVYAVGSERGVHFYAMQLVEGHSLAQVVEEMRHKSVVNGQSSVAKTDDLRATNHEQLTTDTQSVAALSTLHAPRSPLPAFSFCTVAQLAIQAAEALEHAHTCGVIHRDIKPSNLLVDPRGCLWLTDFGLARIDNDTDLTMTGDLLGTLRYMSPEQTQGSRVVLDHRTDIYSLGATLYELLALRPAFDAADRPTLLRQINEEVPTAPRRINPAIPADLETIVLKAMSKEPAARYATAQHLADDLRRLLEHKPIHARRPTLVERAGKWSRRHAALMSITAAALSVVTIACVFAALLTLSAYNSEAQHRSAAVDNLRIASASIDRMLVRVAADQYFHGDLGHAETLAADATEFYEKLLKHSDDPELRFRAAEAHENVAGIWFLLGQHEKARAASLRSIELVRPLIATNSAEGKYLNARGAAYLTLGRAEAGLQRFTDAEEPWQQAAADFQYLIERFPHEPKYRGNMANTLSNLGLFCWTRSRLGEAEQCYKRSIEIRDSLPEAITNTPEYLTTKAGTLSNWAMVARERGDTQRATKLLDQANVLQKRSLDEWPTNPVAVDSLFNQYWHLSETAIRAGQHQAASRAVEAIVWAFPDRLQAQHYGAEQLLKCAALADKAAAVAAESSARSPAKRTAVAWEAQSKSPAEAYRERARELVARAHHAPERTPDTRERFAWFLVTCEDESFHDPPRAVKLATAVLDELPDRGAAWLTLALAHYRLADWPAADEALQKSVQYPRGGGARVCEWLVLAMLRHQQGRSEEASEWHSKARNWLNENTTDFEYVHSLAAEADALLEHEPLVAGPQQ